MPHTKTRVMVYSSNVSDKDKGYCILRECLRQKQGLWYTPRMSHKNQWLWYTPRMSQTKTSGMIYFTNVSDKNRGYRILLECFRQKQGV